MTNALDTIQKEKFKEFLKNLPDFIMSGGTYEQVLCKVLNECDWCYISSKEENVLKIIFNYFT